MTQVTSYCVHHFISNIHTPTVLNMSRKIDIRERKLTNKLTLKKNIRLLKLPCWIGGTEWNLLKHVKKVNTLHGYIMRGHASSSSGMSSYFWLVGAIFISLLADYQDIKPFGIAKKWYFEEIWSARSAFCTLFYSQFVSRRYSWGQDAINTLRWRRGEKSWPNCTATNWI